ncbi:MAG: dienelactone hydrolase family protein, partial [Chloroflexi bacterium]|nr:dienelactone hydrolase family protein [Chloroflexota bacterium]
AHHGYAAICPNLHHRMGPGTPEENSERIRESGGQVDALVVGDVEGALDFLRSSASTGKVGVIGFCSGGRVTLMVAAKIPSLDAAVNCWGGNVIPAPERINANQPVPVFEMLPDVSCPVLGFFGNDDGNPDPEQVNKIEAELKKHGKTYDFHRYDGAGHAFFRWEAKSHRPEQAADAWEKVWAFYAQHLGVGVAATAAVG